MKSSVSDLFLSKPRKRKDDKYHLVKGTFMSWQAKSIEIVFNFTSGVGCHTHWETIKEIDLCWGRKCLYRGKLDVPQSIKCQANVDLSLLRIRLLLFRYSHYPSFYKRNTLFNNQLSSIALHFSSHASKLEGGCISNKLSWIKVFCHWEWVL